MQFTVQNKVSELGINNLTCVLLQSIWHIDLENEYDKFNVYLFIQKIPGLTYLQPLMWKSAD